MNDQPILSMQGVTKTYPGVTALDAVDFALNPGEVHGLVGENGAGKSTFIQILSGYIQPTSGAITLGDAKHTGLTPRLSLAWGIRAIYQDDQLVDSLSCAENIYLGTQPATGLFRRRDLIKAATDLGKRFAIDLPMASLAGTLTIPDRKILSILKAMAAKAKVVLMDEPTVALDEDGKARLGKVIAAARNDGVSIIYISHHLDEVFAIADRLTVLKDGRVVARREKAEFDQEKVVKDMIGKDSDSFFRRRIFGLDYDSPVILEVENLSSGRELRGATFAVRKGQIFGIGGMAGSGRSELLETLFGIRGATGGSIALNGQKLPKLTPREALRRGMAFLTEDRKKTGLVMGRPIFENEVLSKNALFADWRWRENAELDAAVDMSTRLTIATPSVRQLAGNLSGGNQQKTVLAKWLLTSADILLFDEPTVGVDVGAKREIYDLMQELAEAGKTIIVVSSDLPELTILADRVGVMRDGKMVKILERGEISGEAILSHSIGAA